MNLKTIDNVYEHDYIAKAKQEAFIQAKKEINLGTALHNTDLEDYGYSLSVGVVGMMIIFFIALILATSGILTSLFNNTEVFSSILVLSFVLIAVNALIIKLIANRSNLVYM